MASENNYSNKNSEYFKQQRKEMFDFIPADCKFLLDVGCGEGNFGSLVKDKTGAEVWGVELNSDQATLAGKSLDNVLTGDLNDNLAKLPADKFDCIVFNDVLEHFTEPDKVLVNIKKLFSKNGVLVASIPNVRYIGNLRELLIEKDWRYKKEGILDYTHYRFFTYKSILRMFDECGYEVLIIEGINPSRVRWRFKILNLLSLFSLSDSKYLQFACVAKPK
jgi:2-polyprenyl-3-methyl-5-hydroxy-6-metoxy-1,4-benzoquinol methylase